MNANWITPTDFDGKKNFYFAVRKTFFLNQIPDSAHIRISADTNYRLWINNHFIGTGPVRGSVTLQYFDTHCITSCLCPGGNEIFIEVYTAVEENFVFNSLYPGVIAEIPGIVSTDLTWEAQILPCFRRDIPYYTIQSGYMEYCDFRKKLTGDFKPVQLLQHPSLLGKTLLPSPLPPRKKRSFAPVCCERVYALPDSPPEDPRKIPEHLFHETQLPLPEGILSDLESLSVPGPDCMFRPFGKGVGMILNFDREISGRIELLIDAPEGTSLQVSYAEALTNNRVATEFNNEYYFTDCFILAEGVNTITTAFAERGFRIVQLSIRNFDRPVRILRIAGIDRRYPFVKRGTFFSSDYLLNRIFEVCSETLSACSSDVFMDCPWRERAFWVNDLLVNNLASLHCFGPSELHRHCFELAFSQVHDSGMIPAVVPCPRQEQMEENPFIFAATNLFMVLALKDYFFFSNDRETVFEMLPHIERILDAAWNLADEHGILQSQGVTAMWNFFDWSFEQNGYSCEGTRESMLSSLFILSAKTFLELADRLGYECDQTTLQQRWQLTAGNLEKEFLSPESGLLEDEVLFHGTERKKITTQLAHALYLLTGEVSGDRKKAFEDVLIQEKYLKPDYYLHYFYLQAASKIGQELISLERIRRYWGRCIATGSPTLYEAGIHGFGQQAMDGSGSLCHAFGTIPVVFLHEVILGIRPLQGGFAEFFFSPNLLDLKFARGRIPLPHGDISVELTRQQYKITVPEKTKAILPDGSTLFPGEHLLDPCAFPANGFSAFTQNNQSKM